MGIYKVTGKRGERWYADYYCEGRRVREVAGLTRREAERALKVRQAEILQGRFGLHKRIKSPGFQDYAEQYFEWSMANKRSWKRDRVILRHLCRSFGNAPLSKIDRRDVERYRDERLETGVKKVTVDRELVVLRHMLNMAVDRGMLKENPVSSKLFYRVSSKREYYVTPEEEERLLEAAPASLKGIITVALYTGMRQAQILSLRWDQLDLDRGMVSLPASGNKNKKDWTLPLGPTALEVLEAQPRRGPYVFGGDNPATYSHYMFKETLKKAGITDKCRFHDLRHTYLTRMARVTRNTFTLMKLAQHSSVKMTERYVHPAFEDMQRAVRAMDSHKIVIFPQAAVATGSD